MFKKFLTCALYLSAIATNAQQTKEYNNRVIVIGGGGSRGAWGGGFAKHLVDTFGDYRYSFGTSTGSLIAPLLILKQYDQLKQAYTSVDQRDIFSVNPFNTKTGNLKGLKAFWRLIWGKKTFGESKNLRKLIDHFLSDVDYQKIITSENKLMFAVTVVDMESGNKEMKYSTGIPSPKEMKDWIWATANEPLFMSYHTVGSAAYVDGGVRENVPLM